MSAAPKDGTDIEAATRGARRFYWRWLIVATGVSVLGNIAHAVLVAPAHLMVLAAAASVVPPAFIFGSTHSAGPCLKSAASGGSRVGVVDDDR